MPLFTERGKAHACHLPDCIEHGTGTVGCPIEELERRVAQRLTPLHREMERDRNGNDHLWFAVACPTCGAPPDTNCSGDPAETPVALHASEDVEVATYSDGYLEHRYDKPCAKRVVAAILEVLDG